jgi:hypothetical protein
MDLNDDLCRSDLFYDFVVPKVEPGLTPVAFIDSAGDCVSSGGTDPNNNNSMSGTTNHIKSFLDDMLFTDESHLSINSNGLINGSESMGPDFGVITAEEMSRASASLGLLGSFQWSDGSSPNGTTTTGSSPDTNWLTPDGQVTTLTNLLDPIFVTYDGEGGAHETKLQYFTSEGGAENGSVILSSDLISSTYERGSQGSPDTRMILGHDSDLSTNLAWQKQNSPDSQFIFCDAQPTDSSMLLRTALQGGNTTNNKGSLETQSSSPNPNHKSCDNNMIELRRVLSYPPMSSSTSSAPSPTSTSTSSPGSGGETHYQLHPHHLNSNGQFYEFKILDPMFANSSIIPADEANIPNVEELIMTRIDLNSNNTATFYNGNGNQKKKMEISERKINSTTLSTKWTYAMPNSANGQGKPVKRRKKTQKPPLPNTNTRIDSTETCITTNSSSGASDMSGSPNSSHGMNGGPTSRKERSLHYCNICNKGFKDKYSVNVHVRTHTGAREQYLVSISISLIHN